MFKNLREKINEGIVLIVYEHAKRKKKKKSPSAVTWKKWVRKSNSFLETDLLVTVPNPLAQLYMFHQKCCTILSKLYFSKH